ncbi:MAG: translation initiation factor IF-6 [Candidatus Altiarchaeota archaeon]
MIAEQVNIRGEDFIGLLGFATDKYAFVSPDFEEESILGVPTLKAKSYSTNLVGMFCTGNSNGILVPYFVSDMEYDTVVNFMKPLGVEVLKVRDNYTAMGNMMAVNDKKAYVSSVLTRDYKAIEDVLGVEVVTGDIAGRIEVGAYVMATNKGYIAHPDAEHQLKELDGILGCKGMVGTVNCGIPYVKSGLLANGNGYITGSKTTPIELQRIEDGLGLA